MQTLTKTPKVSRLQNVAEGNLKSRNPRTGAQGHGPYGEAVL